MKKYFLTIVVGVVLMGHAFGQPNILAVSGDWATDANWTDGVATNSSSTTAQFANNVSADINDGESFTSGDLTTGTGISLTLSGTSSLDIGDASTPSNLVTSNNATITIGINGTITIWGSLIVNNNLTLVVTGTLIVKGDVILNNGADLDIAGNVEIDGNLTAGENTDLNVEGSVDVGGDVSLGNNSTATGGGSVTIGGGCTDGNTTICTDPNSPLPVTLLFFQARDNDFVVDLEWATASEQNNAYFTVERSLDGIDYELVGGVEGNGTTNSIINYSLTDKNPYYGLSYYRLTQTDLNGDFEVFRPISIYRTALDEVSVYPNPIAPSEELSIVTGTSNDEVVNVQLFNLQGVIVKSTTDIQNGRLQMAMDNKPGIYIVKVTSGAKSVTQRVVVH